MGRGGASDYGSFGSVPDVEPTLSGGGQPLNVRASASSFGGQIGESQQGYGQQVQKAGAQITDIAAKYQGMMNETLATNAETDYMVKLSKMEGEYKSREGIDAVQALPEYTSQVSQLRQQMRTSLPAGAAHAFDMLAIRREGYALSDANVYAAAQVRQADYSSAARGMLASVGEAGRPSVAQNPEQFNAVLDDIKFHAARQLNGDPGVVQDPSTGTYSFADTPQGAASKDHFESKVNGAVGDAYINRLSAIESQSGVLDAYKTYQDEKDNIPKPAQVKLDAYYGPRVKEAQAQQISGQHIAEANNAYLQSVASPESVAEVNSKAALSKAILSQESGSNPNIGTSINGAVGIGQITPETFSQYAKAGENINNPSDNFAVHQRILEDLSKRYKGDPARVAVGYFSGPGNVAPEGSPTPWIKDLKDKNGKSTSSYTNDILQKIGGPGQAPLTTPPSLADHYRENYSNILAKVDAAAEQTHPGNPTFAAKAHAYAEQQMNDVIRQQELSINVDKTKVLQGLNGSLTNGVRPTTMQQLENISPEIKAALGKVMMYDSHLYDTISNKILTENAKGNTSTNSQNFYSALERVLPSQGGLTGLDPIENEYQLHSLLARSDGTGINMKDYQDLKSMMTQPPEVNRLLSEKINQIKNANGNVDGLGELRSLTFLHYAMLDKGRKEQAGIAVSEMIDPESANFIGKTADSMMLSRAQQMRNIAKTTPDRTADNLPKTGDAIDGYKFMGGNPGNKNNWVKVQ